MRHGLALLIAFPLFGGTAYAQSIILPSNADMRAMQAPIDWEGSRSQRTQDADGPAPAGSSLTSMLGTAIPFVGTSASATPPAQGGASSATLSAGAASSDYRIEVVDADGHVETVATSSSLAVAQAAFKQAAKDHLRSRVELRKAGVTVAKRDIQKVAAR